MEIGMPAGLASVITQIQAFISPLLATIFLKQSIRPKQFLGFLIGGFGLFIIGMASTNQSIDSIPILAIFLTILAPIFWAISNLVAKLANKRAEENGVKLNMLNMIVWAALVPPIPMTLFALILDKPSVLINSLLNLKAISIFSVLCLAYLSTLFCYVAWGTFISKYPMSKVAPISLLVPVTGLSTASLVLGERLSTTQWFGTIFILFGLIVANINIKSIFAGNTAEN